MGWQNHQAWRIGGWMFLAAGIAAQLSKLFR